MPNTSTSSDKIPESPLVESGESPSGLDAIAMAQSAAIMEKLERIQSDINAMDSDIADFKAALFRRVWIVAGLAATFSVVLMRLLIWG